MLCINNRMTSSVVLTTLRPFTAYSVLIRPRCDDGYGLCSTRVTSFTTTGAGVCACSVCSIVCVYTVYCMCVLYFSVLCDTCLM